MFGKYVGKVRAEHEHAVAGVQEGLAEELLENLRARPRDDVGRFGRDVELRRGRTPRRPDETPEFRARTIVRLVVLDRLEPPARADAVLSNGLSPISSSTTSLPSALSCFANAEHRERGFYGQGSGEITQLRGHGNTFIGSVE
jgi:GMP synthase PP-ATPase subunit